MDFENADRRQEMEEIIQSIVRDCENMVNEMEYYFQKTGKFPYQQACAPGKPPSESGK